MTRRVPATTEWELVVGLEVHVQLRTRTKIFCDCPTDFGALPNRNTCPVCLALPGALPVLNDQAVALAVRAALALGCEVHERSVFARKHYFYPDLPKGYQISQFEHPLATKGALDIPSRDGRDGVTVGITRVHMEEDAGKSIHDRFPSATAIDLNRTGVPLIEIVSEPDLRSAAQARAYCELLREILVYADVSDANMEEGSLRVDANVSARRHGAERLGTRTEIKNMNSFSGVERAIEAEFARQCALLDGGEAVIQQTMLWDAARSACRPARGKEESHDYRYFPDPDLPPLVLPREWLEAQRAEIPERPAARRERLVGELGITPYDAGVLTASRALADYFEALARAVGDGRTAAHWVMGEVLAFLNESGTSIDTLRVAPGPLASLLAMVTTGTLSHGAAKKVFTLMATTGEDADTIARREALLQVSDDRALAAWVDEVWREHPNEARRLVAGETKLIGPLVGLVMAKSKGRADPRKVNLLLRAKSSR